jgi:D-3-phosphoglycerate dehydrogenase
MSYVVVVADKVAESGLTLLEATPEIEVVRAIGDADLLRAELTRATALLVRSDTQVSQELIELAPQLRVIGRAGIGVDNIDIAAATRRGIAVVNAPGANTVSAAEHSFALLFSLVRRIPWAVESMRKGDWNRKAFGGTELRGKTLGVVGLGRIGAHLTKIAHAIGMKVLAHDPYLSEQRAKELRAELVLLDELLQRADVVTLHLPLPAQTRHTIDARRLAMMKPTALLINAARGELVDEEALVNAVNRGTIAGAAVDVYSQEPLPPDSALRSTDRMILTPHLAASTVEAQERVAVEIATSVRNALLSGDLGGAVNVGGVSGQAVARLGPLLDLARRVGGLAATLNAGRVEAVEVDYGGDEDEAPRLAELAAVEGALHAMGVRPVSMVNARTLAKERGITVSRRAGHPDTGFETTVGVAFRSDAGTTTVVGALIGERIVNARIVSIDGHTVDVPAEGCMLVLRNNDVPGVVGKVGTVLGDAATNIGSYHQSRSTTTPGALAAIVVDQPPAPEVIERLRNLPDVNQVHVADLTGAR